MELRQYIRIVRRRGWIVVALAIMTAAAGFGFSWLQTDIYQAQVNLSVRPARADWGLGQTVSSLLRSLSRDITTHTFLQKVIDRAELDMTTDDLLDGKTLFVKDEASDFTITISVRDPGHDVAVEIVNTTAEIFVEDQKAWNDLQEKRDRIDVRVRDPARFASHYSPNTEVNVVAGGVLGALIGALVVAILEWLEAGVVRSTEDMDRLGIPALGAIPTESGWRR
jgi:capsular polysaccharide biosynthesis protein